jgi:hypothetical protein
MARHALPACDAGQEEEIGRCFKRAAKGRLRAALSLSNQG